MARGPSTAAKRSASRPAIAADGPKGTRPGSHSAWRRHGGLLAEDLTTAHRVLAAVTEPANAELAS